MLEVPKSVAGIVLMLCFAGWWTLFTNPPAVSHAQDWTADNLEVPEATKQVKEKKAEITVAEVADLHRELWLLKREVQVLTRKCDTLLKLQCPKSTGFEVKHLIWTKHLTYGGVWEVWDENGKVVASSLSSSDVEREAESVAAKQRMKIVTVED